MGGLADQVISLSEGSPKSFSLFYGMDVRLTGLRLEQAEQNLSRTFLSPWLDRRKVAKGPTTAASATDFLGMGLESVLPECYNAQPSPPVTSKIASFTDETLFYMFYAMPGDRMQDLAAKELTSRNWRFHKELKVWCMQEDPAAINVQKQMISPDLTAATGGGGSKAKATATAKLPSPTTAVGKELNAYAVFDPQTWAKVTKELPIRADQLEDRFLRPPSL